MSISKSCKLALEQEGIEMSEGDLKLIANRLEAVMERARDKNVDVRVALDTAVKDMADRTEALKAAMKRNEHLNFEARGRISAYINEHWSDNPAEGFHTLLTGVTYNRVGAKDAVAVLQQNLAERYLGIMMSELETKGSDGRTPMEFVKPGLLGKKNKHSDDVAKIMYHMNQEVPNTAAYRNKPASMIKAAEILLRIQEVARKDGNEAGSYRVGKLENRIVARSHDMYAMADAGYDKWKSDMERLGAFENSDIPASEWDSVLRRHYNQTTTGERIVNSTSNPEYNGSPGIGNVSKSMTHERVFHFRDADAEVEYMNLYGHGQLFESVAFGLEMSAQRIALMRKFGPNAMMNINKIADDIGVGLSKGKDTKKYDKFMKKMELVRQNHVPMVDGNIFVPGNKMGAKVGQWYRAITMMAKLGKAVISALSDIPMSGMMARYHGNSFFGGMTEAIGNVARGQTADGRSISAQLGVIADSVRNNSMSRFDPDHISAGGHAKLSEIFFRASLLEPWTSRLRTGFAMARSHDLANLSRRSFKGLPDEWRRVLSQFNIDEAKWDVIKKTKSRNEDGRNYLTPEGVLDLDDAAIKTYLKGIGKNDNKMAITAARNEIADNFRSYFHSVAHNAALEPDASTRGSMLRGSRAGTIPGELIRAVTLFKSFPVAFSRQVIGREAIGHMSSPSLKAVMTDQTALMNLTRMMLSTTLFGTMATYIADLVDGKEPQEINEETWPSIFMRGLLKGGGGGFYADILVAEGKSRYGGGFIGALAGPAFQDVNTIYDIYGMLQDEDATVQDMGAEALRVITKEVPGNNIFYFKMAYDYMFVYNLMEWTNPGSLRRMEKRREKEYGTVYRNPPSRVIPRGGGMPQF